MFPLTLAQLPAILKAEGSPSLGFEDAPNSPVTGAAIDSRAVRPGDLFFALPGGRTDGHDYAAGALARGAAAVVLTRETGDRPALVVPDPAAVLARLGAWNRTRFAGPVVAVGGSHGKTTCREMLHAALTGLGPGTRSRANHNNALGVPLSLCAIGTGHRFAVVELGASRPGELAALCDSARPTVGVLTGIGSAHVGTFGGPGRLRAAKAELLASLPPDALAVLNGDDPRVRSVAPAARCRVVFAGTTPGCDVRLEDVSAVDGRLRFRRAGTRFDLFTPARHLLPLAACAVAVGKELGLTGPRIARGLAAFRPPPGRCAAAVAGGVTVVDDTYNAPPEGFLAAVDLLAGWPVPPPGRRWLVAGGMRDLGGHADRLHRALGDRIRAAGPDRAVFVGATGGRVADAAGLPAGVGVRVASADAAAALLCGELRPGDVALVKGCRADGLERVVAAVLSRFGTGHADS